MRHQCFPWFPPRTHLQALTRHQWYELCFARLDSRLTVGITESCYCIIVCVITRAQSNGLARTRYPFQPAPPSSSSAAPSAPPRLDSWFACFAPAEKNGAGSSSQNDQDDSASSIQHLVGASRLLYSVAADLERASEHSIAHGNSTSGDDVSEQKSLLQAHAPRSASAGRAASAVILSGNQS